MKVSKIPNLGTFYAPDLMPGRLFHCPVAVIGLFDGVHKGHQKVIGHALKKAKEIRGRCMALTFDPPPLKVLHPHRPFYLLTTVSERAGIFEQMGVHGTLVIRFTRRTAALTPEQFVKKVLSPIGVRHVFVGKDFKFGHNRTGDVKMLRSLGKKHGFRVFSVSLKRRNGEKLGSSKIRELLSQGNIETVFRQSGRYPVLTGMVVKGDRRGKHLGFPTANIRLPEDKLCPQTGVYAGLVRMPGSSCKTRQGVVNIGFRPTFYSQKKSLLPSVEVHILNFNGSLYGKTLEVALLKRLRDEKSFTRKEALQAQIYKDILKANQCFLKKTRR